MTYLLLWNNRTISLLHSYVPVNPHESPWAWCSLLIPQSDTSKPHWHHNIYLLIIGKIEIGYLWDMNYLKTM